MYQKLIFIGRTGKDSVMRYTPSGEAVTSFSLAVDDGYGEKKKTVWVNVSTWGKTAELTKDMKKGTLILCEGKLIHDNGSPRIYKKSDGSSGASFEISASNVRFLSGKGESDESAPVDDGLEF
jgi:single-strand DNA-binding protein